MEAKQLEALSIKVYEEKIMEMLKERETVYDMNMAQAYNTMQEKLNILDTAISDCVNKIKELEK